MSGPTSQRDPVYPTSGKCKLPCESGCAADQLGYMTSKFGGLQASAIGCSNQTPQHLRMLAQSDPHSTPPARVNGVVSNRGKFQKAFDCKEGQPMVRENAVRVW
jgi:hypothetical protein